MFSRYLEHFYFSAEEKFIIFMEGGTPIHLIATLGPGSELNLEMSLSKS